MQLNKFEQTLSELITKYNLQYDENKKLKEKILNLNFEIMELKSGNGLYKETIRKRNLMIKDLRSELSLITEGYHNQAETLKMLRNR